MKDLIVFNNIFIISAFSSSEFNINHMRLIIFVFYTKTVH